MSSFDGRSSTGGYNADLEADAMPASVPASVASLKEAIALFDGLIICSPEYNYGVSGVLKNALDWASRPGFNSPLKSKPVLIMTSSPGLLGGVRAQSQLRETLSATLSRVISCPQIVIPGVNQKIRDGRFVDETTIEFMLAAVDDLIGEIKVLTYLFGESLVSTFTAPSEQAWIARYDFDFAAAGLSGLTLGLKYVKGDEVDPTLLKTSQTASLRKMARNGSALPTPPTPYKAARSRTYRHSGATPRTFPPMPTVPMKIA